MFMKKILFAIFTVFALLMLVACSSEKEETPETPDNAVQTQDNQEQVADDSVFGKFNAKDLNGNPVDESIFAENKLTMVNLWGTFCGPCINEMPHLGEISKEYADKSFGVVGILVDVTDNDGNVFEPQFNDALDIVAQTKVEYVNIVPSKELMLKKVASVFSVPETIFVDSEGKQVGQSYLGARNKDQWIKIIDELLGEVE